MQDTCFTFQFKSEDVAWKLLKDRFLKMDVLASERQWHWTVTLEQLLTSIKAQRLCQLYLVSFCFLWDCHDFKNCSIENSIKEWHIVSFFSLNEIPKRQQKKSFQIDKTGSGRCQTNCYSDLQSETIGDGGVGGANKKNGPWQIHLSIWRQIHLKIQCQPHGTLQFSEIQYKSDRGR